MKIQELAIIFIIIILPISLVLSFFTQHQIQAINIQTQYDSKLTEATTDALMAFQLNTANSSTSDIANSKIRDIEASISTFKASLKSTFNMNGYTEEEMNQYIPALVYTMYDGFYIYSRFENQNYLYEITDEGDVTTNPIDNNGENIFGLKPYIPYSVRYKRGNIDVVITYALDNYISIRGTINGNYIDDSGYLIDGIEPGTYGEGNPNGNISYNGVSIENEVLEEYLPINGGGYFKYIEFDGTKYYLDTTGARQRVIYFMNQNLMVQAVEGTDTFNQYKDLIENNRLAKQYYKEAYEFTQRVKNDYGLDDLTYGDAVDIFEYVVNRDGSYTERYIWEGNTTKIFDFNTTTDYTKNIECDKSNFNQHRLAVIRNKIETNLSIAISNFNSIGNNDFRMPNLTEEEWERVMNNICLISFVQGLDVGGNIYNGYTIINNSESKEIVQEENIYILGTDWFYHRIGDHYLENTGAGVIGSTGSASTTPAIPAIAANSAGRFNLDFNRQSLIEEDGIIKYYYPLKDFYASYDSVVSRQNVTAFDDIYAYIIDQKNRGNINLATAFYTALGRERYGMYKDNSKLLNT